MPRLKCVVVGDSAVGKTCLLINYVSSSDQFVPSRLATIGFEFHDTQIVVDDRFIDMLLLDTAGQDRTQQSHQIWFKDADVFLVCFCLINPSSLESVREYWVPQIKKFNPDPNIILAGTKLDLRNNQNTLERLEKEGLAPVQHSDGMKMAQEIGAIRYLECSALSQENVEEVFKEVARTTPICRHCEHQDPKLYTVVVKRKCILL